MTAHRWSCPCPLCVCPPFNRPLHSATNEPPAIVYLVGESPPLHNSSQEVISTLSTRTTVTYEVTDTKGRLAAALTSGNESGPLPRRNPDPRRGPVRRPDRPATAGTTADCAVWQMGRIFFRCICGILTFCS